jgi:hypothetical protein
MDSLRTEMVKAIDANSEKIEKLTEITLRLVERFDTSQKMAEFSERLARVEQKSNL